MLYARPRIGARRIASNITKLPDWMRKGDAMFPTMGSTGSNEVVLIDLALFPTAVSS
jgi:hypothetical protein